MLPRGQTPRTPAPRGPTPRGHLASKTRKSPNIKQLGIDRLRKAARNNQPLFCHHWDGTDSKVLRNKKQEHPFQNAMIRAHHAMLDMGLNFATGMSEDSEAFKNIREGNYGNHREDLENLRQFMFTKGAKVTPKHFNKMLVEYIRVVNRRSKRVCEKIDELFDKDARTLNWKSDWKHADGLVMRPENSGMWGSRRQWTYGKAIAKLMFLYNVTEIKLHAVFAMMLNPTGGIVGDSNGSIFLGDLNNFFVVHAVVHDAYGYLFSYHDQGPGYNYLNAWSLLPTKSPVCCQFMGLWQAHHEMKTSGFLGNNGRQKNLREDVEMRQKFDNNTHKLPEGCLPTVDDLRSDYVERIKRSFEAESSKFFNQMVINHADEHKVLLLGALAALPVAAAWLWFHKKRC